MPQPTFVPGAPCWIDVYTSDPGKTKAFYGDLFGWTSEEAGEEYGNYINFSKDGQRVAGAFRNDGQAGMPDVWTVYLTTDDAKGTVDAVVPAGGQVMMPATDVMELGTMAVVADPGQAAVGVWQPGLHKGFEVLTEVGTPAWFELHSRAYEAAVDFYRTVFKWDAYTASDVPEFRYTTLGEGQTMAAGIMDASAWPEQALPSRWAVYFRVDDVDEALARIVELGGTVVQTAEDTPYGRLAGATDPTGAFFKLMTPPSS